MGELGTQAVGTEPQPPPGYHPLVHTRPPSPLVNGPPFHQPPTHFPDSPCSQSCLSTRLHVGRCPAHARTSPVLTTPSALVPKPGHLGPTPAFRRTPGHSPGLTPSLCTQIQSRRSPAQDERTSRLFAVLLHPLDPTSIPLPPPSRCPGGRPAPPAAQLSRPGPAAFPAQPTGPCTTPPRSSGSWPPSLLSPGLRSGPSCFQDWSKPVGSKEAVDGGGGAAREEGRRGEERGGRREAGGAPGASAGTSVPRNRWLRTVRGWGARRAQHGPGRVWESGPSTCRRAAKGRRRARLFCRQGGWRRGRIPGAARRQRRQPGRGWGAASPSPRGAHLAPSRPGGQAIRTP